VPKLQMCLLPSTLGKRSFRRPPLNMLGRIKTVWNGLRSVTCK